MGCRNATQVESRERTPDAASAPTFTDVTQAAGLGAFRHETGASGQKWLPEIMGAGAAFVDYDGDGWPDILLVGGGVWEDERPVPALRLYRNNGDGTFSEKTREAGLGEVVAYGFGLAVADYDNDGDPDVYFTTLAQNRLFRNEGGVFEEVGKQAGVAGEAAWSTSALFFDADRDGWLDLYVGNYVVWSPDQDLFCSSGSPEKIYCTPQLYEAVPGRFYQNNGDPGSPDRVRGRLLPGQAPTFTDRTAEAGFLPAPGQSLGVAELDFNGDRWPDLVVANDLEPDLLYENNGDPGSTPGQAPTFTEMGVISGIAYDERGIARAGMGIDAGDVDGTGRPTVFVGNFSDQMIGVYRYVGNGLFEDRAALSKIGGRSRRTLAFGLFLFDADLDGDLDLFVANGHIHEHVDQIPNTITYRQPPHLFINQGDGTFEDAAPEVGGALAEPLVGRGAAYADVDQDGDLDVLVTENGGPVRLLRNEVRAPGAATPSPAYLRVEVTGTQSNRDGLGTRLVAFAGGSRQERRVHAGSSYLSQSERPATFGFGPATRVDSLVIYWPNGHVDRFNDLAVNQTLRIVEGASTRRP